MANLDAWLSSNLGINCLAASFVPRLARGSAEKVVAFMERDGVKQSRALVVLNVCRDPLLRNARTKTLDDAGYHTSAAQTPEEAITLAGALDCAVAIVCDSFGPAERRLIHLWMRETSPTTTVVFLENSAHADAELLLSTVKAASASRTL